jgi:hypothetical protein
MTTKHIKESTWRQVEKITVKYITTTQRPIKDTEVLNSLILKGLENIEVEDLRK